MNQRLRVVVARYGPSILGGAERLSRMLATRLAAAGWEVGVVTTRALDERTWADALPAGDTIDDGVRVERHSVRMPRRPQAFRQLSRGFWRLPAAARPEAAWLALQGPWSPGLERSLRERPDLPTLFVGYLYRPSVRGLALVRGARLLLPTAHDERPLHLRAVGRMLDAADGLWYATPEERDIVERAHPTVAGRGATEIGNVAVEAPEGLEQAAARARTRHRLDAAPYLLYAGRDTEGKGVGELLEGLRRLRESHPEIRLVLLGEAGERDDGIAGVVPLGRVDDAERWALTAGAAAVVVPSFHESLSLLALEAWAAGRPAILNAASPVLAGQAARSGAGLTYRGPAELAVVARGLIDDPARADALGAAGRDFVAASSSWPAVIGRLERLLEVAAPAAAARGARW